MSISPKGILIVQSRVSQLTMMGASVRSRRSGLLTYCTSLICGSFHYVDTAGRRLELRFSALPMWDANYLHSSPMIESSTAIISGRRMGAEDAAPRLVSLYCVVSLILTLHSHRSSTLKAVLFTL